MTSTLTAGIPATKYGVLLQDKALTHIEEVAEQVRRLGYAILDSGLSDHDLRVISEGFDETRGAYIKQWGEEHLRSIDEYQTIRAPLVHGSAVFRRLATNPVLMAVLQKLIVGKFILNQQNGVINPPGATYNQGAWHRDLPYQHYVSSTPLAVNALFCVDDFTLDNGSTFVIPATHKEINYPSESFVERNAVQVTAKAGQYILLDCMLFHSGGFNRTQKERRAVNHVFTIPYFKQQIKLAGQLNMDDLTPAERELFGIPYQEPLSIESYLSSRPQIQR